MALHIGPGLNLPLEAVTETFAIVAKRGVGKTYTAAVMVEEMVKARLPVVVVDPIGVWWGLRSSADGKSPGLPVTILGGEHGDLPLEEGAGAVVADFLVDRPAPLVVDVSEFRKGPARHFMTDFLEQLYARNRDPLHVVLDEADEWAPQRPLKGAERLLGACEDLVRRGRARGLGCTLITQRPAVLHKDVLTQAEVLVALRIIGPQDRNAIDEWIKVHGTPEERGHLLASLAKLPVGTSWWWSPGWLDEFRQVKVRRRETFDSSATPKTGRRSAEPRNLATVELDELKEQMAATIERVKADDPKELRRQVRALEQQLAAAKASTPQPEVELVEVPVLPDDVVARLVGSIDLLLDRLEDKVDLVLQLQEIRQRLERRDQATSLASADVVRETRTTSAPRPTALVAERGAQGMSKGAQGLLEVLVQRHPMRLTRAQLATLAQRGPKSSSFGAQINELRRNGFAVEDRGELTATERGLAQLGEAASATRTPEETIDSWRRALPAGPRKMLDVLLDAYPKALARDDLATAAGFSPTSSSVGAHLGVLRRNGLVDVEGGAARASEVLFLS